LLTLCWRELDSNLRFRARAVSGFAPEGPNVGIQLFQRRAGRSPFPPPGHFRESADNEDCAGREAPAPHTSSPGDRWPSIAAGRTQRPHQGHPSRSIPASPRSRRRNRKFVDSPPEEDGFEPSVPRGMGRPLGATKGAKNEVAPQVAAEKAFKRVEEIFAKYPIAEG